MIIYKRYIDKRLWSLRLTFFILGTICFFAFKYYHDNLGYFIAVVLITLSIIVVKDFIVCSHSFSISKYYFFGLIRKTWRFNKGDNVKVSSFGSDFGQDGEITVHDDTVSGLGCLFSIFSIFLPSKITMKEFKLEKFDEFNSHTKNVYILLNRPEFIHLETFIHQPQST
jgi:hypothetical protein